MLECCLIEQDWFLEVLFGFLMTSVKGFWISVCFALDNMEMACSWLVCM